MLAEVSFIVLLSEECKQITYLLLVSCKIKAQLYVHVKARYVRRTLKL